LRLLLVPATACITTAKAFLEGAGLSPENFSLLFKGTLIAVVVRLTAAFCRDVSRSALAVLVEFGGVVCVLLLSVPLLERVVSLLEGWL
ncbi:MAG: stage III sporulation AC/AD family protein, partial [Oscillospiraceae bacterium]|nr:stage III sporulation AC/AD family protein [Oscillospiraceae bacterium]